ncbi:3-hydroxyacyl-[acyl-carrier-protein] dehydratase [Phycisphaerales bacterium]|nr:3-hydroxyacyl-[acyl-carrier-protein] dehydratase [Phycisphaerales bacterium]
MRWLWIDRIVELVPRTRIVTIKNVSLAEEHLHDHFAASGGLPPIPLMPACLIVEGMAQSAGILVGHSEGFREKVALAKVSRAELEADVTPGLTIRYTASIQQMDRVGASTTGTVEVIDPNRPGSARQIGAIDLMFSHLDNNMAGMEFPEHNFVFGESFKMVLRMSGIAADPAPGP